MDSIINIWSPALKPGTLPMYKLAFEIECGSTVGSAAVAALNDGSGDVELYIPSYEFNQVLCMQVSSSFIYDILSTADFGNLIFVSTYIDSCFSAD